MIGVGAAFDFHAGAVRQAPARIQALGLEWAYRLYCEPKRLFRRYFSTNPVFILAALKQLAQAKLFGRQFLKPQAECSSQQPKHLPIGQSIAICIATYQRPELLDALLQSLSRCTLPSGHAVEVRIIDNDAEGSARERVESFRTVASQFSKVHYTIEPRQNIAHARNRAIEMGSADAYVFVDDDETVRQDWLVELVACAERHQADAVFGPVRSQIVVQTTGLESTRRIL